MVKNENGIENRPLKIGQPSEREEAFKAFERAREGNSMVKVQRNRRRFTPEYLEGAE